MWWGRLGELEAIVERADAVQMRVGVNRTAIFTFLIELLWVYEERLLAARNNGVSVAGFIYIIFHLFWRPPKT